jgi:hypothetical protein
MSRLIQLAILAAVIWGIYYWLQNGAPRVILPNSNQSPAAPQTPANPQPSAPAQANPANPANPPATPDPTSQLADAKANAASLTKAVTDAQAPALANLQKDPAYQQAKAAADDLQQKARAARVRGDDDLADLSKQWIAAKNKVSAMESAAFDASPALQKANADLDKVQHQIVELETQIAEARLKAPAPKPH